MQLYPIMVILELMPEYVVILAVFLVVAEWMRRKYKVKVYKTSKQMWVTNLVFRGTVFTGAEDRVYAD